MSRGECKILLQNLRRPTIKRNNKLAIFIHVVLSMTGLAIYGFFVQGVFRQAAFVREVDYAVFSGFDVFLTLIIGTFLYVAAGYMFLQPTENGTTLSVFWLTQITVILAVMMVASRILFPWVETSSGTSVFEIILAIFAVPLPLLFNTVGVGLVSLLEHFEVTRLIESLAILASSLLSPGLLCLGVATLS
ncbi:MAG: hypothetical protein FWC81_00835 [Coriobacteriia bacterium]|nr:hypothetical protein [Coriobacteriia bacterium]